MLVGIWLRWMVVVCQRTRLATEDKHGVPPRQRDSKPLNCYKPQLGVCVCTCVNVYTNGQGFGNIRSLVISQVSLGPLSLFFS